MIQGYKISADKSKMDFSVIYNFLSTSYWAKGIPEDILVRALENSLCFGVFTEQGEQIGFGRAITDYATFAYLSDVFILESHRGKGLSKWLMAEIIKDPRLQNLRRFSLVTGDAHSLYEQFGFKGLSHPERHMERWNPDVYKNN